MSELRSLSVHLRTPELFDPKIWRVFPNVDRRGDCFFDCVSRAINSGRPLHAGLMSPPLLRARIANSITPDNIKDIRIDYVYNTPDESLDAFYMTATLEQLQAFVQTSDHYATRVDICELFDQQLVTPIIINSAYGNLSIQHRKHGYRTQGLIDSYTPRQDRYVRNRFVLLYHTDEHFELVIRTDVRVAEQVMEGLDQNVRHAFRALFTAEEIPPDILAAFEATLEQ